MILLLLGVACTCCSPILWHGCALALCSGLRGPCRLPGPAAQPPELGHPDAWGAEGREGVRNKALSPSESTWLDVGAPSRCRQKQGVAAPSSTHLPCSTSQESVCKKTLVVPADFSGLIWRGIMCNHNNVICASVGNPQSGGGLCAAWRAAFQQSELLHVRIWSPGGMNGYGPAH